MNFNSQLQTTYAWKSDWWKHEGKNLLRREFNSNLRLWVNNKGKSVSWLETTIWMNIHGMFTVLPGIEISLRHFKIVLVFSKLVVV